MKKCWEVVWIAFGLLFLLMILGLIFQKTYLVEFLARSLLRMFHDYTNFRINYDETPTLNYKDYTIKNLLLS